MASGYFILVGKTAVYITNTKIHRCLEIPDLFLALFLADHVLFSLCVVYMNFPVIKVI